MKASLTSSVWRRPTRWRCAPTIRSPTGKRTAFLAAGLFLEKNGLRLMASPLDATLTMVKVAAGEMDVEALAGRIGVHLQAR